ncbi:MAG: hypothetical protein K1X94_20570 [Sandaracinaceae bacterium]|nr:hypothetical protein [Sandaracinaceae bacterium]
MSEETRALEPLDARREPATRARARAAQGSEQDRDEEGREEDRDRDEETAKKGLRPETSR